MQGGGRKKKFAEDEDFDDSEEGSEMSDSEFEDPDEMEVRLKEYTYINKTFLRKCKKCIGKNYICKICNLKNFFVGANGGKEFAPSIICKSSEG